MTSIKTNYRRNHVDFKEKGGALLNTQAGGIFTSSFTKRFTPIDLQLSVQAQIRHLIDLSRQADPDRNLYRMLPLMLASLATACGGGGSVTSTPTSPTPTSPQPTLVSLDASTANYNNPSATGDVEVTGDANDNIIVTGQGDDTVNAVAGDDQITTGSGDDTIDAGAGNDQINAGSGADSITAGAGNDLINAGSGGDTVDAG